MVDATTLRGHWQARLETIGEVVQGREDIEQSIRTIIGTQKRSVPFKSEFGVDWLAVQDRPMSDAAPRVVYDVQVALARWERRIVVKKIEPIIEESRLRVRVHWKLASAASDERATLV